MGCHPRWGFLKNQVGSMPDLQNLFAELIAEALTDGEALATVHPNGGLAEIGRKARGEISCLCSAPTVLGERELDGRFGHCFAF